jgi:hypothetical protein
MRLDSKWRGGASQSASGLLVAKMKARYCPPLKIVILPALSRAEGTRATAPAVTRRKDLLFGLALRFSSSLRDPKDRAGRAFARPL